MLKPGYADTRDMHVVHTMFRREFVLMPELVAGTPAGNKERSQIVAGHVALLNNMLHHHHHAEDVGLWPLLLERAPKECDPIIYVMEGQHSHIEKGVSEIDSALPAWRASAGSDSGQALVAAIERTLPVLYEHMGMEEERILPIAQEYITAPEWDSLAQNATADIPQDDLVVIFGMMMYEGDPEVVQEILSKLPPQISATLKTLGPQAFALHSQRVYGTATPPRSPGLRLLQLAGVPQPS
jgi:hemerythrin-like domain-containing protein